MTSLFDPLFGTAEASEAFSDRARVQGMLDVEAALARAEARAGAIPADAAGPIVRACRADSFDFAALAEAAPLGGNLAIPLVKQLTAAVAAADPEAARWVHWGATSQDVVDTGLVLQLRAARPSLEADLDRLDAALAELAVAHAATPLAARTLMQQATPTTFGLKAAGWLSQLRRARVRVAQAFDAMAVLQFGGASGTLAALGDQGLKVAEALAAELDLALPESPWHTQRDRPADLACALGLLAGGLGKMARDVSLLMQTEVGEAFEPAGAGRGGSSAMPHKRNPVGAAIALAAAVRVPGLVSTMLAAMAQEHERSAGLWHAEWETLPEIVRLTAGALRQMTTVAEGVELDPARMAANLQITGGLPMAEAAAVALAEHVGRADAHRLVERAAKAAAQNGRTLAEALAADPDVTAHLSEGDIVRALRPQAYLGETHIFIARVLAQPRT
jgi:3-carboxy-cis,cis-muconate cycloisomerase